MPLFEVAILAEVSEGEGDVETKLVFGPKAVVAVDEKAAIVMATCAASAGAGMTAKAFDPETLEVLVRPFCG